MSVADWWSKVTSGQQPQQQPQGVPAPAMPQPAQQQVPPAPEFTQQASPAQQAVPNATGGVSNPSAIPALSTTPAATGQQSHLDTFTKMWEATVQAQGQGSDAFNLDANKLHEAISKVDPLQGIDPELMAKATNGDSQALLQLVQQGVRNGMAFSLQAGARIAGQGVQATAADLQSKLTGQVTRSQALSSLAEQNAQLNHPSVKPLVEMLVEKAAITYPTATPAQLQDYAVKYLQNVGMLVASPQQPGLPGNAAPAQAPRTAAQTDWDRF